MQNIENKNRKTTPLRPTQAGFTLLLAALVASIVLALGTSIFEISQKQVTLSGVGRDSQFAFYAADTGAECALYWDDRYQLFSASPYTGPTPVCDEQKLTVTTGTNNPASCSGGSFLQLNLFRDPVLAPNGYCAQICVTKSNAPHTLIHADGFSVDCASIQTSSRALQRSVELQY